ncbi:MAG: response regulator [Pseudorhodoplanes sp.]|nr:response regulator [Pseudorhodoplanes sp.]
MSESKLPQRAGSRTGNAEAGNDPRILLAVVDDDPAVCHSLTFALEIEGFDVRTFGSGDDILNDEHLSSFGCLIIDYSMPGMNGLELLRLLRNRGIATPAILITGVTRPSLHERAQSAGVLIVEKPFSGTLLIDSIRTALART